MKHALRMCLVLFIFFSYSFSYAQEAPPVPASEGMHWFCLSKESADPYTHTAVLGVKEGTGYRDGVDTAVVVRIALDHEIKTAADMDNNSAMTTGDSELDDQILGGHDGLITLQGPDHGLANAGIVDGTNPTQSFPITWTDDLVATEEEGGAADRAHYWYGVQEALPEIDMAAGGAGAQQQGTFTFDEAGSSKDCDVVRWDPYGYVFDAQTLGPVEGVKVAILSSKTENGVYTPVPVGVGEGKVPQNPIATKKDGSYRYYVGPGFYKLLLSSPHTIEKNLSKIKPGYEEFGYEQLYIADTPEVIHELAGKVERRDIAIKTVGAPAPFQKEGPVIRDIMQSQSVSGGKLAVRLTGTVEQLPVHFVAVYQNDLKEVVGEKIFKLEHGHSYVTQGLRDERNFDLWIPVVLEEGKGRFMELRVSSTYSDKTLTFPMNPMPTYLEGIARDAFGMPIVNGTVALRANGIKKPLIRVSTDAEGHFTIYSNKIPPFPYTLHYSSATGKQSSLTTSEFLSQNETYHAQKKINAFSHVVADADLKALEREKNQKLASSAQKNTSVMTQGMQGIVIIICILVLLVGIGVGAYFVMRKKSL